MNRQDNKPQRHGDTDDPSEIRTLGTEHQASGTRSAVLRTLHQAANAVRPHFATVVTRPPIRDNRLRVSWFQGSSLQASMHASAVKITLPYLTIPIQGSAWPIAGVYPLEKDLYRA